jgi:hypothetical protein
MTIALIGAAGMLGKEFKSYYDSLDIQYVPFTMALCLSRENNNKHNASTCVVSATTLSKVTGIPRATCIRKLQKLVTLGFLMRETTSKRYFVNQIIDSRTKNIMNRENVNSTIDIFSQYFAIILNSLIQNQR